MAAAAHDGLDVGEVEVDVADMGDRVGDALDRVEQDVVCLVEGVHDRDVGAEVLQELVVVDHDERIDVLGELGDSRLGVDHVALALEAEGLGHHGYGQRAGLAGDLGDDRGRAGAGAAAHAGGDEHHVGALEQLLDVIAALLSSLAPLVGVAAGTEAAGQLDADLDLALGGGLLQGLRIGVDGDELDSRDALVDHVLQRVSAAAADP